MFRRHETIRHGDKSADGNLSTEGVEQARSKAEVYYYQLKEAPPGTLFFITPSNIGRATETGRTIEEELIEMTAHDEDIEVVSVHDENWREDAEKNPNAKYVIANLQPTQQFGWNERTKYIEAWGKYKNLFQGDDGQIVNAWVTRPDELEQFKIEMEDSYGIDGENINPADFLQTPEEEALKYIRSQHRMGEIKEKYFPGRPFIHVQAGHNPADLAALASTGKKLSLENLKEFTGGTGRDFVGSAALEFGGDGGVIKYRGQEITVSESFEELIERLKKESDTRRREWGVENVSDKS